MAIPTPDSLIAIVKPVPTPTEEFISALGAKMGDADVVKNAYRGAGLFSFYVPGYISQTATTGIEIRKALVEAGYTVHRCDQQVGYMPKDEVTDFKNAGPFDDGVTGPSQFLWVNVVVSKTPVEVQ